MKKEDYYYLRVRAYTITILGAPAIDREPNDPVVERVIENAVTFIDGLPKNIEAPRISGGLPSKLDTIVKLIWFIPGNMPRTVSVSFQKDGTFDLDWIDVSGQNLRHLTVNSPEALAQLNVAQKIDDLSRNITRRSGPFPAPL